MLDAPTPWEDDMPSCKIMCCQQARWPRSLEGSKSGLKANHSFAQDHVSPASLSVKGLKLGLVGIPRVERHLASQSLSGSSLTSTQLEPETQSSATAQFSSTLAQLPLELAQTSPEIEKEPLIIESSL